MRIQKKPVVRSDGKLIKVVPKQGQLFVCQLGCCCGKTERGFPPTFETFYHEEWERRKLRNKVHLTSTACLGPCSLANVALLLFDGHSTWFHSLSTEEHVLAIYDYIEAMLYENDYFPPPPALNDFVFDGFAQHEQSATVS